MGEPTREELQAALNRAAIHLEHAEQRYTEAIITLSPDVVQAAMGRDRAAQAYVDAQDALRAAKDARLAALRALLKAHADELEVLMRRAEQEDGRADVAHLVRNGLREIRHAVLLLEQDAPNGGAA